MGAITCAPEREYSYEGNIRMMGWRSWIPEVGQIIVEDRRDASKAPVMLDARDELKRYLELVRMQSQREDGMRKRFYYDQWCELRKIEVLDDDGNVVKVVNQGGEWEPFIGEIKEADDGTGDPAV